MKNCLTLSSTPLPTINKNEAFQNLFRTRGLFNPNNPFGVFNNSFPANIRVHSNFSSTSTTTTTSPSMGAKIISVQKNTRFEDGKKIETTIEKRGILFIEKGGSNRFKNR